MNVLSIDLLIWLIPFHQIILYLQLCFPWSWLLESKGTLTLEMRPYRVLQVMRTASSNKAAFHLNECVCHEDDASLAVLVSVVVKSMAEGAPESIGEDAVKSVIMGMPDSVTESVLIA